MQLSQLETNYPIQVRGILQLSLVLSCLLKDLNALQEVQVNIFVV